MRILNCELKPAYEEILFLFLVIFSFAALAGNKLSTDISKTNIDSTPVYDMKKYWLVLLYRGPQRNHDSTATAKIQQAHMNNITRLASEGKIIMAGPIASKTDLRGIFIMNGNDSSEVASYINLDSAIITGRLRFEIHPWLTAKGKYEFK